MKWNKIPCNKDKSNNDEYLRRSCDGIMPAALCSVVSITLLHEFSVLLGLITPIFKLSLHFDQNYIPEKFHPDECGSGV